MPSRSETTPTLSQQAKYTAEENLASLNALVGNNEKAREDILAVVNEIEQLTKEEPFGSLSNCQLQLNRLRVIADRLI